MKFAGLTRCDDVYDGSYAFMVRGCWHRFLRNTDGVGPLYAIDAANAAPFELVALADTRYVIDDVEADLSYLRRRALETGVPQILRFAVAVIGAPERDCVMAVFVAVREDPLTVTRSPSLGVQGDLRFPGRDAMLYGTSGMRYGRVVKVVEGAEMKVATPITDAEVGVDLFDGTTGVARHSLKLAVTGGVIDLSCVVACVTKEMPIYVKLGKKYKFFFSF